MEGDSSPDTGHNPSTESKKRYPCGHAGCTHEFADARGKRRHEQKGWLHPQTGTHIPNECSCCLHWRKEGRLKDSINNESAPKSKRHKRSKNENASEPATVEQPPPIQPSASVRSRTPLQLMQFQAVQVQNQTANAFPTQIHITQQQQFLARHEEGYPAVVSTLSNPSLYPEPLFLEHPIPEKMHAIVI